MKRAKKRVISEFRYFVVVGCGLEKLLNEIGWCRKNIKRRNWNFAAGRFMFEFRHECDATLFRLRQR